MFFQENKELSQLTPKWYPWGVKWNWKLSFSPFWRAYCMKGTPVPGNPVFEAPLYPFPSVSFSDEMCKRHCWWKACLEPLGLSLGNYNLQIEFIHIFFLGEVSFLCRLGIEACLSSNICKKKNNLFSSNKGGPLHNEFLFDRDGHFWSPDGQLVLLSLSSWENFLTITEA